MVKLLLAGTTTLNQPPHVYYEYVVVPENKVDQCHPYIIRAINTPHLHRSKAISLLVTSSLTTFGSYELMTMLI